MKMTPLSNVSLMISAMQVYTLTEPQFTLKLFCYQGKFESISLVKSRIAQRQGITMPRLELLGNLILARLMNSDKIAKTKGVQIDNV